MVTSAPKRFAFLLIAAAILVAKPRAAGEIRLVRAVSMLMLDTARLDSASARDTNVVQSTYFLMSIRNIAYEKRVSLWARNDSAWDSLPCSWVRQADDDNEYWELKKEFTPRYGQNEPPRDLEFKLMYVEGKTTYWDDNGGKNYRLAMNGGTLLGKANLLFKNAKWALDTGLTPDTTVFSGQVEVRGYQAGSSLKISYTTDYLNTQDIRVLPGPPVPTWKGAAPAADSDRVYLYSFAIAGIKRPYRMNPYLHFHFIYGDGTRDWIDDNRSHQYALNLGSRLDQLVYEELPVPAMLRYPHGAGAAAESGRDLPRGRMGAMPVFHLGSRTIDGIGRSR
ncbi:MAG: endonuclease/exonuclease/phosphatase [Fibrobacteres bacterium]|nr:endonuclease/exonuclease/phosphatase [Fibrobacterota bacterium]